MNLRKNLKNSSTPKNTKRVMTEEVSPEEIAMKLKYLGGTITSSMELKGKEEQEERKMVDIEEFFLNATNFVFTDVRLTRCLEFWVCRYGKYLSPSKIRTLIKKGVVFNTAVLGVFLEIALGKFWNGGKFRLLTPFVKKNKEKRPLFAHLPTSLIKMNDPIWYKYGFIAPLFIADNEEEENHFLRPYAYVIDHVPELKYRVLGYYLPLADLRAFIDCEGKKSLYEMAKRCHASYATFHRMYKDYVAPITM